MFTESKTGFKKGMLVYKNGGFKEPPWIIYLEIIVYA